MFRYLINFSYIGTAFRGIQRVVRRTIDQRSDDIHSVQGVIELALQRLGPVNDVNASISSRTDAGVHALSTALHVDLERRDGKAYNPNYITFQLNNTFYRYQIPVRINRTYVIPPDLNFHCRFHAVSRRYLYRFAVIKPDKAPDFTYNDFQPTFIPIEETDRCYFLQTPDFDFEAVKDACPMFEGIHDFRTFMGVNPTVKEKHCMYTIRRLTSVSIKPTQSCASSFNFKTASDHYNYYDIEVAGKSFLYRQVRRMVAALIALGQGKITRKDVYEMITIPGAHNWLAKTRTAPATGLYLCEVVHDKEKFQHIVAYNESFEQATGRQRQLETN